MLNAAELDRQTWSLGVANGVVDLKTGVMRPDSRDEFVTKRCPVNFHPAAKSPHWDRFISEITAVPNGVHNGKNKPVLRQHLAAYLQRALGYCLTGDTREQVMFITVGKGSNGKNVLLDTLKAIAGDYAETIAPEVLMAAKFDNGAEQASPSTRKLAGARVAISSESKEGQKLDLAVVKRHTGGLSTMMRTRASTSMVWRVRRKMRRKSEKPNSFQISLKVQTLPKARAASNVRDEAEIAGANFAGSRPATLRRPSITESSSPLI